MALKCKWQKEYLSELSEHFEACYFLCISIFTLLNTTRFRVACCPEAMNGRIMRLYEQLLSEG